MDVIVKEMIKKTPLIFENESGACDVYDTDWKIT